MTPTVTSLDQQREAFAARRFLAMPLAGTIAWTCVGIAGTVLSSRAASMALFIATGMIAYIGILLSKLTGEDFFSKSRPKNAFDSLFFFTLAEALLVYAIAIPFYFVDHTSLPLTVGILTGIMWLPFSWIIQHWIGIFHSLVRTVLVLAAWYALPDHRFTAIPAVIVLVYGATIFFFERRWRALNAQA